MQKIIFFIVLFILALSQSTVVKALIVSDTVKINNIEELARNELWLNLLHYEGSESIVFEESPFFLSKEGYKNPRAELEATILAIYNKDVSKNDSHAICLYPARLEFILRNTKLENEKLPKPKCSQFEEFLLKAPIENLSIVFASENNTFPSSMMGHIFIKISGLRDGIQREHAFSFFAAINNSDSIYFYSKVLTSGIDGIYMLSPYRTKKEEYLYGEQRSLWEFQMNLSKKQKEYFQKHLWELKDKNVKYTFLTHNCGTATINLLKIIDPKIADNINKPFVTPINYIKKLNEKAVFDDLTLNPSAEYQLKMIRDNYSFREIYAAKKDITNGKKETDIKQAYLVNKLAKYQSIKRRISEEEYEKVYSDVDESKIDIITSVKNPLNSNLSSKISINYEKMGEEHLTVEVFPVYQDFFDVSLAHFDNLESKLLNLEVKYNINNNNLYINKIDILSMKSIIDASITNDFSKYIKISLENDLNIENFHLRPNVEGGLGYSYSFFNNIISPFFMPIIGYRYNNVNNFYILPQVGIILKPLEKVKTIITYEKYFDSKKNNRGFNSKLGFSLNYLYLENKNISLRYNKYGDVGENNHSDEFLLGLGFNF